MSNINECAINKTIQILHQPLSLKKMAFLKTINKISENDIECLLETLEFQYKSFLERLENKKQKKLIEDIRILNTCLLLTSKNEYEYCVLIKIIDLHKKLSRKNQVLGDLLKTCYEIKESLDYSPSAFHGLRNKSWLIVHNKVFDIFGYDESCGIELTSSEPLSYCRKICMNYKEKIDLYLSRIDKRSTKIMYRINFKFDMMNLFLKWYYE